MRAITGYYRHVFEEILAAMDVAEDIAGASAPEYQHLLEAVCNEAIRRETLATEPLRRSA